MGQARQGDWSISGRPSASMRTAASSGPDGPELWVLWGPSGSGKSRYAKEHWPGAFWKTPYTQWWDGYGTHDTVILDDFRGDCMRLTDLQRLLDWYPLWVEIKGWIATDASDPIRHHVQSASCRLVHQRRPHGTILRRVRDFAEAHGRLLEFPLERGP